MKNVLIYLLMDFVSYAKPCDEFSHFSALSQDKRLEPAKLKETLNFLNKGRRGFLLVLNEGQEPATIEPGDLVFAVR